jgi:phage gpG-like protein
LKNPRCLLINIGGLLIGSTVQKRNYFQEMAVKVTQSGKLSSGELKNKGLAGLDRGLILAGQLVAQRATGKAPIATGRLKRSITFGHATGDAIQQGRPYSRPGGTRAIDVGTNVIYAKIQEFGGRIPEHPITPRVKQALAFKGPNAPAGLKPGKGGLFVFKSVNHPGAIIPAQPYLRPALKESRKDIDIIIGKSVLGAMNS